VQCSNRNGVQSALDWRGVARNMSRGRRVGRKHWMHVMPHNACTGAEQQTTAQRCSSTVPSPARLSHLQVDAEGCWLLILLGSQLGFSNSMTFDVSGVLSSCLLLQVTSLCSSFLQHHVYSTFITLIQVGAAWSLLPLQVASDAAARLGPAVSVSLLRSCSTMFTARSLRFNRLMRHGRCCPCR
jgi:hypothetical protein